MMSYNIQIVTVLPQTLAATRGKSIASSIGPKLLQLLSEVWQFVRTSGLEHTGHNVALYPGKAGGMRLDCDMEIPIEAAVQVLSTFESTGRVFCSASPGGLAATAAHIGPYSKLPEAHTAIQEWCHENGHTLAGANWELYGHWTDNEDELRTDVFYLLFDPGKMPTEQV